MIIVMMVNINRIPSSLDVAAGIKNNLAVATTPCKVLSISRTLAQALYRLNDRSISHLSEALSLYSIIRLMKTRTVATPSC